MRKKRYVSRSIVFVICAIFAIAFLLPTVLGIALCCLFTAVFGA